MSTPNDNYDVEVLTPSERREALLKQIQQDQAKKKQKK